jgi:fructokinase
MGDKTGKVYCIGETLLDIIFSGRTPVTATPGGSMLNSAVSVGRSGVPVAMIGECGNDQAGGLIHEFLRSNHVSTEFLCRQENCQTTLALAFLDGQKNATYSFYKSPATGRPPGTLPLVQAQDVILFGSFHSLTAGVRTWLTGFLRQAREHGAFILYDPNFRNAHRDDLEAVRPMILENLAMADLVRGSDEDFLNIFNAKNASEAWETVSRAGCRMLVYTRNSEGVTAMGPGFEKSYPVPVITPVSTIGAGDAFNAGIIRAMMENPEWRQSLATGFLTADAWDRMIETGIRFSTEVCMSADNYIS